MLVTFIPAFSDNYIWILRKEHFVVVVDPGEADSVLKYLESSKATLAAILITHHHADHIGGVSKLKEAYPAAPVYAPLKEKDKIPTATHFLVDGDSVNIPQFQLSFAVLDVGGHTLGHIAYLGANKLFCGDTLFSAGCGRIFEGTPSQMWHSLQRIRELPPTTEIYCAHEYTKSNIRFARAVEPGNQKLIERERQQRTVPSLLEEELGTNPFLRWDQSEVIKAARNYSNQPNLDDPIKIFAAIREWKNNF